MAEARAAQLKRRVDQLEAQLGQSRSLRQELDDRVNASKVAGVVNTLLMQETIHVNNPKVTAFVCAGDFFRHVIGSCLEQTCLAPSSMNDSC